jgi:hypothetical protein
MSVLLFWVATSCGLAGKTPVFRTNILSSSSGLKWGCWEMESLYRVKRKTRIGRPVQPELRNQEEIVWNNRESSCRETEEGWVGGEREKIGPFWGQPVG